MATVNQLRDTLAKLSSRHGDVEVQVWLPGSYITLTPDPFLNTVTGVVLIEGNLKPGSALER